MKGEHNKKYMQDLAVFRIRDLNGPWREVIHCGKRMILPKNSIIRIAEEAMFYFLNDGRIRLTGLSETGRERVVLMMESGVIFGEVPILHKSFDHFHSFQTLTKCDLIAFPKSLLEDVDFCREYPHLILNLLKSIGIKAGAFFGQLYDSHLLDSRGMICRMLAQIWREQGRAGIITPNLSQTEMANILGIHRSSVCRVLKQLREEKIIGRFTRSCLEVYNSDALMKSGELDSY